MTLLADWCRSWRFSDALTAEGPDSTLYRRSEIDKSPRRIAITFIIISVSGALLAWNSQPQEPVRCRKMAAFVAPFYLPSIALTAI